MDMPQDMVVFSASSGDCGDPRNRGSDGSKPQGKSDENRPPQDQLWFQIISQNSALEFRAKKFESSFLTCLHVYWGGVLYLWGLRNCWYCDHRRYHFHEPWSIQTSAGPQVGHLLKWGKSSIAICSMVLEDLPTLARTKSPSFVGKHTSTMEHLGYYYTLW